MSPTPWVRYRRRWPLLIIELGQPTDGEWRTIAHRHLWWRASTWSQINAIAAMLDEVA